MEKIIETLEKGWKLVAMPHHEVTARGFDPRTVAELEKAEAVRVPATVPGCFELDFAAAGIAKDLYFGQNPLAFQQYENLHLWYYTAFDSTVTEAILRFEGIDTVADLYLNGAFLGHTENMLIPHEFRAENLKKTGNELVVHITPATIYARRFPLTPYHRAQKYNYESLSLRKAAYMYGWDIMPRFVSGGLWRPVRLLTRPAERIEQAYLATVSYNAKKNSASLEFFFEIATDADLLSDLTISVKGKCDISVFESTDRVWHTYGIRRFSVAEPALWYPKNAGDHPLYDVTVTLSRGKTVLDTRTFRFGIRDLTLSRTSVIDEAGNGRFQFVVNGKKVFCLGTNWVPLDAFPCRHEDKLPEALKLLDDCGCNTVRCWGGNVYESDAFFDYCDEHGILVWQDFAMGCAIYPDTERMRGEWTAEAVSVIRRLRNHPSLALWAGDNENDTVIRSTFSSKQNPNDYAVSRDFLPRLVRENDPVRPFLPSSPYLDRTAIETRRPTSEEHLWGPRDYFKGDYYKKADCCFASEIGYHGCPAPSSLEKFIPREALWPILHDGTPKADWLVHAASPELAANGPYAYRIKLMISQVETMFGKSADNLADFAKQSQISQAEADKYFIEKFRVRRNRNGGIIWWNLLDGWPQISDAVTDWYGVRKLAYHYIARAQQPLALMFAEPENGELALVAVSDGAKDTDLTYTVKDLLTGEVAASGEAHVAEDSATEIARIAETDTFRFLYIEWKTAAGKEGNNHFATRTRDIPYDVYLRAISLCGYDEFEGF